VLYNHEAIEALETLNRFRIPASYVELLPYCSTTLPVITAWALMCRMSIENGSWLKAFELERVLHKKGIDLWNDVKRSIYPSTKEPLTRAVACLFEQTQLQAREDDGHR
jgi:hypothetical protein